MTGIRVDQQEGKMMTLKRYITLKRQYEDAYSRDLQVRNPSASDLLEDYFGSEGDAMRNFWASLRISGEEAAFRAISGDEENIEIAWQEAR